MEHVFRGRTRSAAWVPGLDDVSRDGLFLDTGMLSENYRGVILARVPDEREERNLSWLARSVAVELSADGKQLLLYEEGSNPDRQEEVFTTYIRPTDGSDATRLGDGRALALSPDRQWALVVRATPETHLVLLPTGEGEPQRLPGAVRFCIDGRSFSPTGSGSCSTPTTSRGKPAPTSRTSKEGPRSRLARKACVGRSFRRTDARPFSSVTREESSSIRQTARGIPGRFPVLKDFRFSGAPMARQSMSGPGRNRR